MHQEEIKKTSGQLRMTPQRERILQHLKKASQPVSAQDLYERMQDIDRATIFRNLPALSQAGLIQEIDFGEERRYEYLGDKSAHHHAICESCGEVVHFDLPTKKLNALIPLDHFVGPHVQITIRGLCTCECH